MWIMSAFGFFSVVQKKGERELTIRARVRNDLEQLRDRYLPQLGQIEEGTGSDYGFRARVPREAFAEAMRQAALEVDYPTLRGVVGKKQGTRREQIYSSVWRTLSELESV